MTVVMDIPKVEIDVENLIKDKLIAFENAISESEFLEIDGDVEGTSPQDHFIKVLNHRSEAAYHISVDAIIKQDLKPIIKALETGILISLEGVTRIVGYYSRISNWNASKRGELYDRAQGNYWNSKRVLDEDTKRSLDSR